MNKNGAFKLNFLDTFWDALKIEQRFVLLDVLLLVTGLLLVFTEAKVILFHVIFVLLTIGAFFWTFPAFVLRTMLWVTVTVTVLLISIYSGDIPAEELSEIPLLSLILLLVFVIAGQRSRAVKTLQKRTDELSMLLEISGQVALSQTLEPLLSQILDYLKAAVAFECATIFKLGDDAELTALAYQGWAWQGDRSSLDLSLQDTNLGRQLLQNGEPVIISDVRDDTSLAQEFRAAVGDQFEAIYPRPCSWMGVPLKIKNQVIGVLALQHKTPRHYYSPGNADLVLGFANQAAVAIETARYYEQAQSLATIEERQRLARDLHDAVSQTLFSASLSAEVLPRLWERNPIEGRRCLEEVHLLTRSALAEMRTLLLELRPEALTETELGDLLNQLTEAMGNRVRLPVSLKTEKFDLLPPDVQIALYRISQEALNNVAKHATASRAEVQLRPRSFTTLKNEPKSTAGLELRISDDGHGFDPDKISPGSFGLDIMQERAEAIGAELKIYSQIGRGTEIIVRWPGVQ